MMSTPEVSIIFLANKFPGFPRSGVQVSMRSSYNREVLTEAREAEICRIWRDRVTQNPHLYDGSKFRYHSATAEGGMAQLNLGLTSYREFLATNWAPDAKLLRAKGQEQCSNSQAFMSDALGVGNFVETCDGHVIFIRRSQTVGEAQGLWDVPGGHPEPQEVTGGSPNLDQIDMAALPPTGVLDEVYESTLREIRDEVNIPLATLSEPCLMGVAANHTSSGRPSAEFYVRCSLDRSEVLSLYKEGGAEADESSSITFIHTENITAIEGNKMWGEMAPSAKGCMKLYDALMTRAGETVP